MSSLRLIALSVIVLFLPVSNALPADTTDEEAIVGVAKTFVEGMITKNLALLESVYIHPSAIQIGVSDGVLAQPFDGEKHTAGGFIDRFASLTDSYDERLTDFDVFVHNGIATLTCNYTFYRNGEYSHKGIDIFTMVKTAGGWKIVSLVWTKE